MRIVINALSAKWGGAQTYLRYLLEHAEEYGHIKVFVLADASLELPVKRNVQRVNVGSFAINPLLRLIWERCYLRGLLKSLKADIYFCPGGVLSVKPPNGCRSVVMFRNMLPFNRKERLRYGFGYVGLRLHMLERLLLNGMKKADVVIFISDFARSTIEKRVGNGIVRSVTIPHGIADRFRDVSEKKDGSLPAGFNRDEYLLYVSYFEPYKRQVEVVKAYAMLRKRRSTREKLVLMGPNSSKYGRQVRKEIGRLGLENDVILTGNVAHDDLAAFYRNAKIGLFASTCENCPNILLESLGAGRPMIVSNREPMPEFAGDAVLYFDPDRPEDLASKIESIIDTPDTMAKLSQKALLRSKKYDWESTSQQTWNVLEQIANGNIN